MVVVVDRTQEAFTVFMAIPASKEAEFRTKVVGKPGCEIVTFDEFRTGVPTILERTIQRNDYPGQEMGGALIELLATYPGTPFGVTFSGGLAVTKADYDYALRIHSRFRTDPVLSARNRAEQPSGSDPIDPGVHLGALLGSGFLHPRK